MTEPLRDDPSLATATEGDLARRIRETGGAGPEEAELCRRLLPRVRLYGLRHLRDPGSAADLAQHVMMLTLEKLRSGAVEQPGRITSFVLGAARMAARDLGRADARWRAQTGDEVARAPIDHGREPLDTERLRRCLGELAERERTIVVLTFYDRMSGPQIAGRLGLTDGNVRVIRMRALNRLRDCVGSGPAEEAR